MVKLRRVSLIESYILESKYLTLEAKKDLEDLKAYLGDDLFDSYMKIRDKIPKDQNDFKDFSKLKKMNKKDIRDFVDNFKSKSNKKKKDKQEGADKLYEDSDWVVYKIISYPAAQLYGKGTKWCITGRYPGHEERGEEYFNDYIEENDLDGGYYFYISKEDPDEKYCVLQTKDKEIHSIWDASDTNKGSSILDLDVSLPEIPEVNLHKSIASLLEAIDYNDLDEVNEELENIKYLNTNDEDGDTPLTFALGVDNIDINIIKSLVDHGASIDYPNEKGYTPVVLSVLYGNKDILDYFLSKGADPNTINKKDNNSLLAISYLVNNIDIFKFLLDHGANTDVVLNTKEYRNRSLLLDALEKGRLDVVEILLNNGLNPNVKDKNGIVPLFYAVSYKDIPSIKLLLSYGADINAKAPNGKTVLSIAIEDGYFDIIKLLVDAGAEIDISSLSAVEDLDLFKYLFQSFNLDVNGKGKSGAPILVSQAYDGSEEIVNFLLDNGANINSVDKDGFTPLHEACLSNNLDMVKLLLNRGANPNVKSKSGSTPIFKCWFSSGDKNIPIYKELLKYGVDVNSKNNDGETLLHFYCLRPHLKNMKVIKFLLDNGADSNIKDNDGKSPYDTTDKEIKDILDKYKD